MSFPLILSASMWEKSTEKMFHLYFGWWQYEALKKCHFEILISFSLRPWWGYIEMKSLSCLDHLLSGGAAAVLFFIHHHGSKSAPKLTVHYSHLFSHSQSNPSRARISWWVKWLRMTLHNKPRCFYFRIHERCIWLCLCELISSNNVPADILILHFL